MATQDSTSRFKETHGMSYTGEHHAWLGMKQRCYNENNPKYPLYGGRGIRVCDRWLDSFEAFYEDMGDRPSDSHSLDRIDNDGNYEPDNCRWATPKQQARNRSTNHDITYRGETKTLKEWAKELGMNRITLFTRLERLGWDVEKAFTEPVRENAPKQITFRGETHTVAGWARKLGIGYQTLYKRLYAQEWSVERALTEPTNPYRTKG